jgi:hypothetical protein
VTPRELAEVIADWLGDAAVLRRNGNVAGAEILERCAREAKESTAEEFMLWISEGEAMTRSGHVAAWFRARFEAMRREGHARTMKRGVRQYRACAVPRRANRAIAELRGREAARRLKGAA